MNTLSQHTGHDETTQVLIVGGSLVGLSTSLFLSRHGIASVLVERHPGISVHPRVASLTARTLEIFRSVGAEVGIRQVEPPFSLGSNVPLVETLVSEAVDNLMEDFSAYFTPASPVQGSLIAQDVLETVLPGLAKQAGGDLRYQTEMLSFEQDEEGVTATIQDQSSGTSRRVRAQFLIAADGSKSGIRQKLGIGRHGAGSLGHSMSIVFEAPGLIELFRKREAVMCFLANDTVIGALSAYPGSSVRQDLFRLDATYDPDTETTADFPEERCLELIRAALGTSDYPVQFKGVAPWEMVARIADRFQDGRIFLVGDAARTQPPTGALGGNTGIAEAHNLAWKLAAVLRGEADQRLLTTYDAERRPLADHIVEQVALLSQERMTEGSEGITVNTLVLSMGYRYHAGAAIVPEAGAENLPLLQLPERWTGQPGTRAPHVVLEHEGESISTLDLFGSHFVVLAGPQGQHWLTAAQHAQDAFYLSLYSYQIGGEGSLSDTDNAFCDAYGISPDGAVLVRPDGFIGWRSQSGKGDAEQELTQALLTLLFR